MASDSNNSNDRLSTVSSLYGPGTILCWYLTTLSVLISWTPHPHRKKSGSIDVDLIATLTLPSVAAGHVISQAQGSVRQLLEDQDLQLTSAIAALEAPFVVVESFMALSIILFLTAAWMVKIRRAVSVAVVGLLCFAVECYIHYSISASWRFRYEADTGTKDSPTFMRRFVADFTGLIVAISIMLSLIITCSISMLGVFLIFAPKKSSTSHRDNQGIQQMHRIRMNTLTPVRRVSTQAADTHDHRLHVTRGLLHGLATRSVEKARAVRLVTVISILTLPFSFFASISPSALNSAQVFSQAVSFWHALKDSMTTFVQHFFPQSNCSLQDLDQAVAAATGATVLLFNIYSVARAYHELLKNRSEADAEQ